MKRHFTIRLAEGMESQAALRLLGQYFARTWEPKTNLLVDGELFVRDPQVAWVGKHMAIRASRWKMFRKIAPFASFSFESVRVTPLRAELFVEMQRTGNHSAWAWGILMGLFAAVFVYIAEITWLLLFPLAILALGGLTPLVEATLMARDLRKQMECVVGEHERRVRESAVEPCPFKKGDHVIYTPTKRGYDYTDGERMEIGRTYRVEEIQDVNYVVVEGYRHPGGGLYWTEFKKA